MELFLLIGTLFITFDSLQVCSSSCEVGWKAFMGSCYFFNAQQSFDHGSAKSECLSRGSILIEVHSKQEDDFILGEITMLGYPEMRLGIVYDEDSNQFIWESSKTVMNYKNWNSGRPDNNIEDPLCARYRSNNNEHGWDDNICSISWGYICEKPQESNEFSHLGKWDISTNATGKILSEDQAISNVDCIAGCYFWTECNMVAFKKLNGKCLYMTLSDGYANPTDPEMERFTKG